MIKVIAGLGIASMVVAGLVFGNVPSKAPASPTISKVLIETGCRYPSETESTCLAYITMSKELVGTSKQGQLYKVVTLGGISTTRWSADGKTELGTTVDWAGGQSNEVYLFCSKTFPAVITPSKDEKSFDVVLANGFASEADEYGVQLYGFHCDGNQFSYLDKPNPGDLEAATYNVPTLNAIYDLAWQASLKAEQ